MTLRKGKYIHSMLSLAFQLEIISGLWLWYQVESEVLREGSIKHLGSLTRWNSRGQSSELLKHPEFVYQTTEAERGSYKKDSRSIRVSGGTCLGAAPSEKVKKKE